jgi:dTDP-4-amino-4,6-dideoxygalactose transaminase
MQNTPAAVPLLDIARSNQEIRDEVIQSIAAVYDSGKFLYGPAVTELEQTVAQICNTKHAVGCASGSDALLLALMALDIGPGDEVIVPSFTFFATASAVARLGAQVVFADIDARTFNLDPSAVAAKINSKTRAIIPVHLFGQSAAMTELCNIAGDCDIPVIEDAAQAIGAAYHGRPIGSWGLMGCTSFYPTKNLGGLGDGGMLVLDSDTLADRLRLLSGHGMRPRYFHKEIGINSRLDTIQAVALVVKIKRLQAYNQARQEIANRYDLMLAAAGIVDS